MPISSELLNDEEEVLVDMRPHWIFFSGPAAVTALALVAAIAIELETPNGWSWLHWGLLVVVGVPAVWLAIRVGRWFGMSLVVTNFRILVRRGVFGRDLTQLRFQRVTEVHMNQSFLERLVGSGQLILDVQGGDADVTVDDIRHPRELQRVLNNQLDRFDFPDAFEHRSPGGGPAPAPARGPGPYDPQGRTPPHGTTTVVVPTNPGAPPAPSGSAPPAPASAPSPAAAAPAHTSVADQLIALDDLRRRGIISDEEFAAKKAELLDRL